MVPLLRKVEQKYSKKWSKIFLKAEQKYSKKWSKIIEKIVYFCFSFAKLFLKVEKVEDLKVVNRLERQAKTVIHVIQI